jgi:hypothetical protein
MKLKRRGVLARYGEEVDRMYAGGGTEVTLDSLVGSSSRP